jgi:predicted RNase H-like HicB family nuclease
LPQISENMLDQTIILEVSQEEDGGFVAEGLTEDIFTQGDTWEELKENVIEAVKGYYFDQPSLPNVKLHLIKDELILMR